MGALWLVTSNSVCAATWDKIDLNGYFSFEYEKTLSGDDEEDTNGSYDLDLFDLVINVQATDRLRLATDLTWEHGSATEDGRGNVAVEYAFAEYTIDNMLRIKAGKMFTHFGIYNEIHTAKPAMLTVKEPLATNKNNKFGSNIRFYPRWLTGIGLQGDALLRGMSLDYDLQISNGETEEGLHNPFEEDDNTHKAVNGRVRLMPSDDLRIGVSFYTDSMEDPESEGRIEINSYGVQVEGELQSGFGYELEYTGGTEETQHMGKITRNAYSAMAYYRYTDTLTPYFRHEYLEPDTNVDDDEATRTAAGINYMADNNLYLKFEINKITTGSANLKFEGADWVEAKASISIGF